MTIVDNNISVSASNSCEFKVFFSGKECADLQSYESRELPPIANPSASCDFNLFFGFFFDGTRNNYNQCKQNEGYSNVASLYDAFPGQVVPRHCVTQGGRTNYGS